MKLRILTILTISGLLFSNCGQKSPKSQTQTSGPAQEQGISDFELVNGIGPITEEISLNEVTQERLDEGQSIFKTKCSACHKVTERYIGPDLGLVLNNRTPTYVMNMILNPDGMVKEHPEAKALLAEFLAPMPNQNLTEDEALAIVQYMKSVTRDE